MRKMRIRVRSMNYCFDWKKKLVRNVKMRVSLPLSSYLGWKMNWMRKMKIRVRSMNYCFDWKKKLVRN